MDNVITFPTLPEYNEYRNIDADTAMAIILALGDELLKAHDERTVMDAYYRAKTAIEAAIVTVTETEVT